jgi:hypothetical protein
MKFLTRDQLYAIADIAITAGAVMTGMMGETTRQRWDALSTTARVIHISLVVLAATMATWGILYRQWVRKQQHKTLLDKYK